MYPDILRGDKESVTFDLHPEDHIAVFEDLNEGTFQLHSQIGGFLRGLFGHSKLAQKNEAFVIHTVTKQVRS